MKACTQRGAVTQIVRAGQWPQACPPDLKAHVSTCPTCAEEAHMLSVFAAARSAAMLSTPTQTAGLLWWKAQLRRRREAMERLDRPATAIPVFAIAASMASLLAVTATIWKGSHLLRGIAALVPTGWSGWMGISVAALLGSFALVALLVGLGVPEKRP